MKGQTEPVDLLGVALVTVVIILISAVFQRDTIIESLRQIATFTGPAVARDMSGLLTMTAAAPGDITITYYQGAKFAYAVDAADHVVKITITKGVQDANGQITGSSGTISNLKKSLSDCNKFYISKKGGQYDISCYEAQTVQ